MRCAYHPDVETSLGCGKCGKPICPKCMVQTPVGARCPDCAKLYKLPTYRVSTKHYLSAAGVGLGMAIICGVAWGVIEWATPFFSINLLLAPSAGYGIGEIISLSVNRKRAWGLATISGIAVAISYITSLWFISFLSGVSFSRVLPLGYFNLVYNLIALALGIFIAVSRLR
jgi:hypothetical protein